MRLISDYHTHSKYSRFFHGKNKILEMVIAGNEMGLGEIAITDHGFKHICGTNKEKIKKARKEVDDINSWSTTKVLLGIEADIIAEDGTIDVDNETLSMIDILIIGYHKMIKTDFASYFGKTDKSEGSKIRCTNAYINAINRYPVTIISHLDSILTTDLYEIGVACRNKGVLIEINNRHCKWNQDQVDDLIASGCLFIVSSDAHSIASVGKVDNAFNIIKKYNIPTELVVNVEFNEDEKTENHKEADAYMSLYKKKKQEQEEKIEAREYKKRTEFTELSDEMEKALEKIATEKGLGYNRPTEEEIEDINSSDFVNSFSFADNEDLIRRAQEYIARKTELEKSENNQTLANNPEEYNILEDDKNVAHQEETQRGGFVSTQNLIADDGERGGLSKAVQESEKQSKFNPLASVERAVKEEPAQPQVQQLQQSQEFPTNKTIGNTQGVTINKTISKPQESSVSQSEQTKPQTQYKRKSPYTEKINFTEPTKKSRVSSNSGNLGSLENLIGIKETGKPAEKIQDKPQKTEQKKKNFGGFVGAGIVDTAEKNKSSKK